MNGGVYVYRTRKPGALFRIPILSYHFAYVGETTSFYRRDRQHRLGESKFGPMKAQPWSDLGPRCVLRIPLPPWKPLMRSVETVVILALWPVYNHRKNLWNPRRIPLAAAKRQHAQRVAWGWSFNFRPVHLIVPLTLAIIAKMWGVW